MAQNIGTLVSAAVRPNDDLDLIASAFSNEIKGGNHGYPTLAERDSIIVERREWGMLCTVYSGGSDNGIYYLNYGEVDTDITNNANWIYFSAVTSANIYTSGATLSGNTVIFNTNTQLSAYTVDLSALGNTGSTLVPLIYNDALDAPNNSVKTAFGVNTINSGATWSNILGGNNNYVNDDGTIYSVFSGAQPDVVANYVGVIGGDNNQVKSAENSFIIGGTGNYLNRRGTTGPSGASASAFTISSRYSLIMGGRNNYTSIIGMVSYGYIGPPSGNYAYGPNDPFFPLDRWYSNDVEIGNNNYTLIGNGFNNGIFAAPFSSIINGSGNTINSSVSTYYGVGPGKFGGTGAIYGPYFTKHSTIAGGVNNTIGNVTYNSISHFGVYAPNYYSTGGIENSIIGGGEENKIEGGTNLYNISYNNAILAGKQNLIRRNNIGNSIIGGGLQNRIQGGNNAFIGAGTGNFNRSNNAIIGAGTGNTITNGQYSGIFAGADNSLQGFHSIIVGGENNRVVSNQSNHAFIGGGFTNEIQGGADYATIVGGRNHIINNADYTFIGGGSGNQISINCHYSFVGGGKDNRATASYSFVGGGKDNRAAGVNSIVVGGSQNRVVGGIGGYGGSGSTIVGGGNIGETASNVIWNASYAFIGGGAGNQIQYTYVGALQSKYSDYSIILGGRSNYIIDSFGSTILNSYRIMGESGRNHIINSNNSIIGAGADNFITGSTTSLDSIGTGPTITGAGINVLVNGYRNSIYDSENSFIGTGVYNRMRDASNSSIIGGADNFISGVTNVHIIGSNITGTTANTTYVERFNIGVADVDNTVGDLLVRDTDGTVKVREVTSISGATSGATVGGIPTKFSLKTGFTQDVPLTITHGFGLTDTDEQFDIIVQLRDMDAGGGAGEEVGGFVDNFQANSVDVTFSQDYANIKVVIIG